MPSHHVVDLLESYGIAGTALTACTCTSDRSKKDHHRRFFKWSRRNPSTPIRASLTSSRICTGRKRSFQMACQSPWMPTTLLVSWNQQDSRILLDGLLTYPLTTPPRTLSTSMGFWICWKNPLRVPPVPHGINAHCSIIPISIARRHPSLKRPRMSSVSARS